MNIQQMAERLNMTPRAIRFYEQKGLLKPQRQAENQYRIYVEADAWRLQTIGALRELGVPLDQISRLMKGLEAGDQDEFTAYLSVQRSLLFERWTGMKQLLTGLDALIDKAASMEGLSLDDLYHLADQEKRMKANRSVWVDRWNYNEIAVRFDGGKGEVDGLVEVPTAISDYDRVLAEAAAAVRPRPGEKGLDLGTGTGNLAGKLLKVGVHMAGIDQSSAMLRQCRNKYPTMETKLGNLMSIPYFDGSFDLVVSSFALQHLTDEQKLLALEETARVLRTQGRVCFADYMYTDEAHQASCMNRWELEGNKSRLQVAANKHYPKCAVLLEWFRSHHFLAYSQSLDDEEGLLHLIVAERRG